MLVTPAGTCFISRDLTAGGYAVVRSHPEVPAAAASMLVAVVSTSSLTHDHADELSFELFAGGVRIVRDGGKYGYADDAWRKYFVSDLAHNVVTLAGRSFTSQETARPGSPPSNLRLEGEEYVLRGAVRRGAALEHARTLGYRPEKRLDILDEVRAGPSERPVALLHLGSAVEPEIV
jgi:hypothetical protein